jgi:hypothetical protein
MKPHRIRSRRGVIFALLMALLFAVVVLGRDLAADPHHHSPAIKDALAAGQARAPVPVRAALTAELNKTPLSSAAGAVA